MLASYFSHELLPYVPWALTAYLIVSSTHVTASFSSLPIQRIPGKALIGPVRFPAQLETRRARDLLGLPVGWEGGAGEISVHPQGRTILPLLASSLCPLGRKTHVLSGSSQPLELAPILAS